MKATEIMIGDRLAYRGQFAAFDFRVEQVTKQKVGYHAEPGENRIHYLRLNEVQPIPLTPEILEWNGFEKVQNLLVLQWENGVYPSMIFVEYNSENYCLFINDMMFPKPVRFLHELHHILMDCGIKKKITL